MPSFLPFGPTAWLTGCGSTQCFLDHVLEAFVPEDAFLIHMLSNSHQVVVGNAFLQPHSVDPASLVWRGAQSQIEGVQRNQRIRYQAEMGVNA
jgi:hypothetical protein